MQQRSTPPISQSEIPGRATCGVNNSTKYIELLSRKAREVLEKETESTILKPIVHKVLQCLYKANVNSFLYNGVGMRYLERIHICSLGKRSLNFQQKYQLNFLHDFLKLHFWKHYKC